MLRAFAAFLLAVPYRVILGRVGRRPRIIPPLLAWGGRRVRLGDDVRSEPFAWLSTDPGGRIEIGSRCELGAFSRLDAASGHIVLGDDSSVNAFCALSGYGGLDIGHSVRIASHTVVLSSSHRHGDVTRTIREQGIDRRPTVIGDDVWLGTHVVVVGGVRIGAHSVIGAGAVVTTDIPPYAVAAGVPARVLSIRSAETAAAQQGGDS